MTIEHLFYMQVASILAYVAAAFWLYRALVAQKDAAIQLLDYRNQILEKRITELETQTPDSLVESLSKRVAISRTEIDALNSDRDRHIGEIKRKEDELDGISEKLSKLQDLMRESDLVCPKCGAPLFRRGSFPVIGEFNGREIEADITYVEYECGYSVSDDRSDPVSPCTS